MSEKLPIAAKFIDLDNHEYDSLYVPSVLSGTTAPRFVGFAINKKQRHLLDTHRFVPTYIETLQFMSEKDRTVFHTTAAVALPTTSVDFKPVVREGRIDYELVYFCRVVATDGEESAIIGTRAKSGISVAVKAYYNSKLDQFTLHSVCSNNEADEDRLLLGGIWICGEFVEKEVLHLSVN